jgi:hypothetical protein
VDVQQSSLLGSQTEFAVNWQVVASQHVLPAQPDVPPQSHCSPGSTIPFPHWLPVIVVTSLLAVRQVVLTLFLPIAEQMLPTVQGENFWMLVPVLGFMMYCPPASQVVELKGQHC